MGGAERGDNGLRQLLGGKDTRPHRIVDVVIDVGDAVGEPDDLRLERGRRRHRPRMVQDAVAHLPREVQALPVVLQMVDDAEGLLRMAERAAEHRAERLLAEMAERRVPEVVAERDRLGEVFVEPQGPRGRTGDLRDVERVR
jgi:hypothetical protein